MKKTVYIIAAFLFLQTSCFARDFIVEFLDENYQETQADFSYAPLIYHSIQVRTPAGSKLLVLTGDDYHYRKWLREYIAEDKSFIVKVPEDQNDLFVTSSAFEIDVTNLHPLNLSKYKQGEKKSNDGLNERDSEGTMSDSYRDKTQVGILKKEAEDQKPKKNVPMKRASQGLKLKKE